MDDGPRLFGASAEPKPSRTPMFAVAGIAVAAALIGGWFYRASTLEAPIPGASSSAAPKPPHVPKDVPVPGVTKPVPAGTLRMGGPGGDADELPEHEVKIEAFEVDETEVTIKAYAACVTAGSCTEPDKNGACNWGKAELSDHPVNCVDFDQAAAYCKFVGKRLPREEEWEFAAHGEEVQRFPWKTGEPEGQVCWNGEGNDEGRGKRSSTCPVGAYPAGASPFGALDMAGNVFEWTDSPYCPYDKPDCANTEKVIRGGAWNNFVPAYLRAKDRSKERPQTRNGNIGFRCVK